MKAATRKAPAARGRSGRAARGRFKLPDLGLTRAQALGVAAVAGALVLGAVVYASWSAYASREVNYERAMKTSPAYKAYLAGIVALQTGRVREAEDALQRAIKEDPANALPYNELAKLYVQEGDLQKALVTSENGVNAAPGSADLYYTLGLTRYQSGRFAEAAQSLERAVALRSSFPEALLWLGNTYLMQSKLGGVAEGGDPAKLEDAIAMFRRAAALAPDVGGYHFALAEGLYQRRDLAEARVEVERALELEPNSASYLVALGKICDQLNDLEAAAAAFERAAERDPSLAETFYGLGLARFKMQQDEAAAEALRGALKINPFHVDAHEKLGQALIRMGQQEEGERELRAAAESREREQTINELRRASAADPSNAQMANNLGIELARQGDYEEALQAFQRAISANPGFIDAKYQIAGLYAQRNKPLEAIRAFMEVDKQQPGYRWTNYYLAKLNEKISRKTEADKRMRMFEEQKARGELTEN